MKQFCMVMFAMVISISIPALGSDCDGDEILGPPELLRVSSVSTAATIDVDLDGDLDIVAGSGGSIALVKNNGDGTFAMRTILQDTRGSFSVVVGDVNGDGLQDIVGAGVYMAPDGDRGVLVMLNNGDETFEINTYPVTLDVTVSPLWVRLVDVNGDGRLDIVTANRGRVKITVLINIFNVTFGLAQEIELDGFDFVDLAFGDIDMDGDPDMMVAQINTGRVRQLRNNGSGVFSFAAETVIRGSPTGVEFGDLDGDGDLDVVATTQDGFMIDDVHVLVNNGSGLLTNGASYSITESDWNGAEDCVLGDLNGDGILDIVTANGIAGDISVLLGNGDASFGGPQSAPSSGGFVYSVEMVDMNGDGALDVLSASPDLSSMVGVMLNQCVPGACDADLDHNEILDFFDVSAFLDAFAAQDPIADFTEDGIYDFFDVSDFLDAFGAGCP